MPLYNGGRIGSNNKPFTGGDPNYSNVSLLLNGNGTNGSTTFTDSSSYSHTVTPVGNAQISTVQSKFGGSSMYFDGNGDYLTIPDDTSFHLGSDSFTIEFWIYRNSTATMNITNKRVSSASSVHWIWFTIRNTGVLHLYATSNGSSWDIASDFNFGNTALSTGQWYHIALVRNGTEFATYVDGTKSPNTFTNSASISTGGSNTVQIGGDPAYNASYVNGYIDDLRITKGVARYTSNFTPPTAQLPGGETGTFASGLWTLEEQSVAIRKELWPGFTIPIVTDGLVLNLDAGDTNSYPGSGTTWYDLSGNGNDGSISNLTHTSGTDGYFDFNGTSSLATVSSFSDDSNTALSVFCWINPDTMSDQLNVDGNYYNWIINKRPTISPNSSNSWQMVTSNSKISVIMWNSSGTTITPNQTSASTLNVNQWQYVGFTTPGTNGSTLKHYIDGSLDFSGTLSGNRGIATKDIMLGRAGWDAIHYWNGKISNVQIYNRELTASEITQNFNALKGRYGL